MISRLARIAEIACGLVLMVFLGDAAGATSTAPAANGPVVDVTSKYMTQSSNFVLTGKIRDYTGLKSLAISLNGEPAQAVPLAGAFKVPLKLKPGQNEILLKTVDKAGHGATNMVVVTLEGSTQVGINPAALAFWHKKYEEQMQAMHKELAKEPAPAITQSASDSVKALNDSAAELRKTLASLGASTTPVPEPEGPSPVAAKQNSASDKRIDNTAPLIEITSPRDAISTQYLLAGSATDDTGVSRLTVTLNQSKPMPLKLIHGSFQTALVLEHGSNVIRIAAADAAQNHTVQSLHVVVRNPTSNNLIDAAVKSGKLDQGHALLYKVFAAFGDPRLPRKYSGDDSHITDNHVLDMVPMQLDKLTPEMQNELVPFFIPAFYRGSWFSLRYENSTDPSASAKRNIPPNEGYSIRPAVYLRNDGHGVKKPRSMASVYHRSLGGRGRGKEVFVSDAVVPPCKLNPGDCQIAAGWKYLDWEDAPGKGVRVWYLDRHLPTDDAPPKDGMAGFHSIGPKKEVYREQAERLLNEIKTKIWPRLTKLMNRKPLSDASLGTNGGNGLLDVALVPGTLHMNGRLSPDVFGLTMKNTSLRNLGCEKKSVYIELRRTLSDKDLRDDMTHEFMHSLQWTYNVDAFCVDNYEWLMESTAQWAIDYVYGKSSGENDNFEQIYGKTFVKHPGVSLESRDYAGDTTHTCANHCYDSYLFFFYLSHGYSPRWIRSIWEATEDAPTSMKAVQSGLKNAGSTNLDQRFPEFVRRNWDSGPEKQYQKWDDLVVHPRLTLDKTIGGLPQGSETLQLPVSLRHLSSAYYKIDFSDPDVRSVAVYNGYGYKLNRAVRKGAGLIGSPSQSRMASADIWSVSALPKKDRKGRHLQALVKIGGKWQKNPHNGEPYIDVGPGKAFCAGSPGNQLDSLVVIASNSRMPGQGGVLGPRGQSPIVYASNMGCGPWKGTIEKEDNGPSSVHGQWAFTTHFSTGAIQSTTTSIRTERQYKAMAGGMQSPGAGDMGDIAELLASGWGKSTATASASVPEGWPIGGRFLFPFGAILSFGLGETTWSANYPNCGHTSGKYKSLVLVITYNFVRSGALYRHFMLMSWPAPLMSISMAKLASDPTSSFRLPYRAWDPESKKCHTEDRSPPLQPFLGTMEKDGVHAQGSLSGANYTPGNGSANYYFHLQARQGKN